MDAGRICRPAASGCIAAAGGVAGDGSATTTTGCSCQGRAGSAAPGPQAAIETPDDATAEPAASAGTVGKPPTAAAAKAAWPKTMRDQIAAVLASLHPAPLAAAAVAATFKRSPMASVQAVLDALEDLGRVQQDAGLYRRTD